MPRRSVPTHEQATQPKRQSAPASHSEWDSKRTLLVTTLQLAVPLWIEELRHQSWEHILARAKVCSQVVAEKGDVILFKSKKKGESAEAFNRLAEGIACLSFCPGGVKIWGEHWEAVLSDDVPDRSRNVLADLCKVLVKALGGVE